MKGKRKSYLNFAYNLFYYFSHIVTILDIKPEKLELFMNLEHRQVQDMWTFRKHEKNEKELRFCNKLKSSDSNIFTILWCKPLIFQT